MKTETIDVRSWDDLVFMNRNRAYGAYSVRKSYSRSMITGLGISVSVACLLLIIPKIIAQFGSTPPEKPTTEIITPIELKHVPEITKPQPPPVAPPPPPPAAAVQPPIANLPPTPVAQEVDTEIPTNEQINNAQPTVDPNASGVGPVVDLPPGPPDETDYTKEFIVVQVPPAFEGGQQGLARFISRNTRYPSADRRLGTQGTVYVSFVVDRDGSIRDVKVVRGISATCDKEAIRVISTMKGWSPGIQNEHKVAVRMTMPIRFQLGEL